MRRRRRLSLGNCRTLSIGGTKRQTDSLVLCLVGERGTTGVVKTILALSFAAFVLATCSPASARLGETLEECKARYGEPISDYDAKQDYLKTTLGVVYVFMKHIPIEDGAITTRIYVTLVDGTAQRIRYETEYYTGFSDEIQETFLSLNGWVGPAASFCDKNTPDAQRLNPELRARAQSKSVLVERIQLVEKEKQIEKDKAASKLEGF